MLYNHKNHVYNLMQYIINHHKSQILRIQGQLLSEINFSINEITYELSLNLNVSYSSRLNVEFNHYNVVFRSLTYFLKLLYIFGIETKNKVNQ